MKLFNMNGVIFIASVNILEVFGKDFLDTIISVIASPTFIRNFQFEISPLSSSTYFMKESRIFISLKTQSFFNSLGPVLCFLEHRFNEIVFIAFL